MTDTTSPLTPPESRIHRGYQALGLVAVLFGLVTIKEGSSVLFFDGPARQAAGNYVPFVLMFNTCAGILYSAAGAGILLNRRWAGKLARLLAVSTLLVFAALGVHIMQGNAYETRTVGAMVLRAGFWVAVALILQRSPAFRCSHCSTPNSGKGVSA
jgi:hypothetical protein